MESSNKRAIWVTEKEASHLMVLLAETPTLLDRAKKIRHPVDEAELNAIQQKARSVCWDFLYEHKAEAFGKKVCECGNYRPHEEGDYPAGNWWTVCANCGRKPS
jgi:hypothetical protein